MQQAIAFRRRRARGVLLFTAIQRIPTQTEHDSGARHHTAHDSMGDHAIMNGAEGEALTPPSASHRDAGEGLESNTWMLPLGSHRGVPIAGGGAVHSEPPPSTPQSRWCSPGGVLGPLGQASAGHAGDSGTATWRTARWHGHVAWPDGTARWASAAQLLVRRDS